MSVKGPLTTAILIPVTRSEFLEDLIESIAAQSSPLDEILFLINGFDLQNRQVLTDRLNSALLLTPVSTETSVVILDTDSRLKTSEAARILLDACTCDYAGLVADDDMLDLDFVQAWRECLQTVGRPTLLTARIERFIVAEGQRNSLGVIEPSAFLTTHHSINRLLSLLGGLLPGGGTVFPVQTAKSLAVFQSPTAIVTEDQLMSSRFFRNGVSWRPMIGARYLAREHANRTGGGTSAEAFGSGVVRALQIEEESNDLLVLLAKAATWRDFHRMPEDLRTDFTAGFRTAGGSPRLLSGVARVPQPQWAVSAARTMRRVVLRGMR